MTLEYDIIVIAEDNPDATRLGSRTPLQPHAAW